MSKVINGQVYDYVDTICDDEIIYDVYMNERDEVVYVPIDVIE